MYPIQSYYSTIDCFLYGVYYISRLTYFITGGL